VSELKVPELSCQVEDLIVTIWPYQRFNTI